MSALVIAFRNPKPPQWKRRPAAKVDSGFVRKARRLELSADPAVIELLEGLIEQQIVKWEQSDGEGA